MNMLRAERAKAGENMVFINSKSIELDSRITTLRSSIREKRSDLNKIKTESIKSGKIILSDYYRTINASRNVDSLSKMVPVIKPQLLTDIKVETYASSRYHKLIFIVFFQDQETNGGKFYHIRIIFNCSISELV